MRAIFFIILFLLAFAERTLFDFGPNFELVTAAMILSGAYLGRKYCVWLVFLVMLATDIILGNTSIFIFTWSGFLIPAFILSSVFGLRKMSGSGKVAAGTLVGVASTLFFYLWTNFGVWYLDSWGMYPDDISGLVMSYINALPFLRMQMTSTLLFVPSSFALVEVSRAYLKKTAQALSPRTSSAYT